MLSELVQALVRCGNEAADDVFLEALRLGAEAEKALALNALLRRKTVRGLAGVVGQYDGLPAGLQSTILQNIRGFQSALRECARSGDAGVALTAIRLIALGRQGKLSYVLSEALHATHDAVSRGAVEALVAMARWVATETRRLQRVDAATDSAEQERAAVYRQLMEERPEIEQAVARALDVHRGRHGAELLRAALLLADWPLSRTLAILKTARHGGQTAMIRRLQQAPDSEHLEAFLLGATHADLRSQFGVVFSHIAEPPVLDAILRKTHWLKDQQLQLCMHQAVRGAWFNASDLEKDLARRDDHDAARIGEWIAASGLADSAQDELLEKLRLQLGQHMPGRLRLLRLAMRRPRGASVVLLRSFLADPDERLVRLAVREIVRRRPRDYENLLLQMMAGASASVRRVIGRAVGQSGFDNFWDRYERLDRSTRRAAGRAMLKLLPDGAQRLERRLRSGPIEQRLKALEIAEDLEVADTVSGLLVQLCQDVNPRLRSKAVAVLAGMKSVPPDVLLEKAVNDHDARVRANAIEVLEERRRSEFVPLLAERARSAHNRERANAVKALHTMRVGTASSQLLNMLQDARPEHRISALWALRQIGWWQMLHEVGRLAKEDPNLRVRRYAMAVLRGVAEMLEESRRNKAG